MKALNVIEVADPTAPPSARLELVETEVPEPGAGEVLVRMEASPCNPSDLVYLVGRYGVPTLYGRPGGGEGCGTVVGSGGGWLARRLRGKRVACAGTRSHGTWAEYTVASAKACLPVRPSIPSDQAATLLINPFTAFGLLDRARELDSPAVVLNAAASQVGRLVIRIARMRGVSAIATVRRREQERGLRAIGAEHVLVTSDPGYEEELSSLAHGLGARVAFDAVAGDDTARLLTALPAGSTAIVYGGLSVTHGDPYGGRYPVTRMVFDSGRIEGFWLSRALPELGPLRILARSRQIQRLFADGALDTTIRSRSAFEDYPAAIDAYAADMSAGKAILAMSEG